jgi:hypothetical protein
MPSHCRQSQLWLLSSVLIILAFDFLSRQDLQASCICVRFGLPRLECGGFLLRLGISPGTSLLPGLSSRSQCPDTRLEILNLLI